MLAVVGAAFAATSGALLKNKADTKKYAKELNLLKQETSNAQGLLEETTTALRQEQLKVLQTARVLRETQLKQAATEEALVQLSQQNVGENATLLEKLILYEQDIERLKHDSSELEQQLATVRTVKEKDGVERDEELRGWISELLRMLSSHKQGEIATQEFVAQLVGLVNAMGDIAGLEEISPLEFILRDCAYKSLAGSAEGTPVKGSSGVFVDWEDRLRLALSSPNYLAKLMQTGAEASSAQIENTDSSYANTFEARLPMRLPLTPVNRRLNLTADEPKAVPQSKLKENSTDLGNSLPTSQMSAEFPTKKPVKAANSVSSSVLDSEGNIRLTNNKNTARVARKPAKAKISMDMSLDDSVGHKEHGFNDGEGGGQLYLR